MRKTYDAGTLRKSDIADDPMVQFERWFEAARSAEVPDWVEANAMTLATSDGETPTARIVLLKGFGNRDGDPIWTFYTNYTSEKGVQIAENRTVSLCFYWPHQQRQVRITGAATKTPRQQTEQYFQSRPRESQLGAVISDQSAVIESRESLQKSWDDLRQTYADRSIPCPDNWGGYDVTGHRIEFWQGRPGRLHDRIRFRRDDQKWIVERLAP